MRILSVLLGLSGVLTQFIPQTHSLVPLVDARGLAWPWVSLGAMSMGALVYFLAPKD